MLAGKVWSGTRAQHTAPSIRSQLHKDQLDRKNCRQKGRTILAFPHCTKLGRFTRSFITAWYTVQDFENPFAVPIFSMFDINCIRPRPIDYNVRLGRVDEIRTHRKTHPDIRSVAVSFSSELLHCFVMQVPSRWALRSWVPVATCSSCRERERERSRSQWVHWMRACNYIRSIWLIFHSKASKIGQM